MASGTNTAEIAVKRVLTRDGTSSYFINNQPVRRRDVQDVFLGTGLGPRAYAIIGQGTISRIIESRPKSCACSSKRRPGVSKYKERRRETENRLADTRENLTRVEDILRELNANLEKLEKQAEMAAKYNALNADATLKQHQQWFLKRAEAEAEQTKVRLEGLQAVNDLESRMADLRAVESDLETIRQAHYAAGDQVNQAQGKLYEATAEVGRLEAEIRYVVEGRERVEQRLSTLAEQIAQWQARKEEADTELENLAGAGVEAEERAELLAAQLEEQAMQLPDLEDALRQAQTRASEQRASVVQVQQQIGVLAAEQRSLDEQSRQLDTRYERLRADRNALAAPDEARLNNLRSQLEAAQEQAETTEARLAELQDTVPQLDEDRRARQQDVNTESARQTDLSARMEALKALQEKRSRPTASCSPWLASHGLDGHARPVEPHPHRTRLGKRPAKPPCGTPGRPGSGQPGAGARLSGLEPKTMRPRPRWLSTAPRPRACPSPTGAHTALSDLAAHPRRQPERGADGLAAGLLHRPDAGRGPEPPRQLQPGEATRTCPRAMASAAHSVSFYAQDSEQSGLLARAQEIEHLERNCAPRP